MMEKIKKSLPFFKKISSMGKNAAVLPALAILLSMFNLPISGNNLLDEYAISKIKARFTLKENSQDGKAFKAEIMLVNESGRDLKNWKLCFDLARPISLSGSSLNEARITKSVGDYYEISGMTVVPSGGTISIDIAGKGVIRKYSDVPACYFIVDGSNSCIPVQAGVDLSCISVKTTGTVSGYRAPGQLNNDMVQPVSVIPYPAEIKMDETAGSLDFKQVKSIIFEGNSKDVDDTITAFLDEFDPLTSSAHMVLSKEDNLRDGRNITVSIDPELKTDEYFLTVNDSGIQLKGGSKGGVLYGLITIFQIAENHFWQIPYATVHDYPKFRYRGTLVDTVSNFRTVDEIKKWILLSAYYKLNIVQLRLSGDEAWRIEIGQYPGLTNTGAFRGYYENIPMLHNSGFEKAGGYYSRDEMRIIIDYANKLNITIIPEIDLPGQARALIVSFTDRNGNNPLIDKNDLSVYRTKENYTDSVLNPGIDETYVIVDNILKEITTLFNEQVTRGMQFAEYVRICNEGIPDGIWGRSLLIRKLKEQNNIPDIPGVERYFMIKIRDMLLKYGCKMILSEGFTEICDNKGNSLIISKDNATGGICARKGYGVILSPPEYLNFDLSYSPDVSEPGPYYAGYVDARKIYSYIPIKEDISPDTAKNIMGIQGNLYTQEINSPLLGMRKLFQKNYLDSSMEYMGFPKMTAFSETAWSIDSVKSWKGFVRRYQSDKRILDKFDIALREQGIE